MPDRLPAAEREKFMASEELISLIVPVYNVENYLDRCLESLVNQTYKNLEILLIDDGSPDRSGEIAEAWQKKDGRIRLIERCDKLVYNPVRLYYYYQREGSTVRRADTRAMRDLYSMRRQRYVYAKEKYPDIEINYRRFFSECLLLSQYLDEDEQRWVREELKELWPRVKKTASAKDKLKYFFCIHMSSLYYALCRVKKRIIG